MLATVEAHSGIPSLEALNTKHEPTTSLSMLRHSDVWLFATIQGLHEGTGHKDPSNRPPWPENPRILASELSKQGTTRSSVDSSP